MRWLLGSSLILLAVAALSEANDTAAHDAIVAGWSDGLLNEDKADDVVHDTVARWREIARDGHVP
jgi:hypothetical protein